MLFSGCSLVITLFSMSVLATGRLICQKCSRMPPMFTGNEAKKESPLTLSFRLLIGASVPDFSTDMMVTT